MKGDGVPFAVEPGGKVVDPATAAKRDRYYLCLDCGTHVRVRRGVERAAHFAHYAQPHEGTNACSAESVLHKASKRLLAEHLANLPDTLTLVQPCQGHYRLDGVRVNCSNTIEVTVPLPDYDRVTLERVFGPYRLDLALLKTDAVVMAFEIYYAHEVTDDKARALDGAGLPWLELEAVRHGETPPRWRPKTPLERSCGQCEEQQRVRDAEVDRRQRTLLYAFADTGLVRAAGAVAEVEYACPACGTPVYLDVGGRAPVLRHEGDAPCSPAEVLRAAAWFRLDEALAEPARIRRAADCKFHYDGCAGRRLDAVSWGSCQFKRSGDQVSVLRASDQVMSIRLTRGEPQLQKGGGEKILRLKMADLIDDPFVWQYGETYVCKSCEDHRRRFGHALRAKTRLPSKVNVDTARLAFVKSYLERFGVDPRLAGHYPFLIKKSDCCDAEMVFFNSDLPAETGGLEPLLWRSGSTNYPYNLCPGCRKGLLPNYDNAVEARTLMLTYRVWLGSRGG